MDKFVVTELIQNDLTIDNLERELDLLLNNRQKASAIQKITPN